MQDPTRKAIETVWAMERPRLLGGLARITRDLDAAEDLAQEVLVTALEQWPVSGVPDNPGAWLMTAAKNRAIDQLRRRKRIDQKLDALGGNTANFTPSPQPSPEDTLDEDVGDDLLRLMLIACHPILAREARIALTLRLLGGLSTEEIARAFLTAETTVAQRIVRAKRTLAEARVPFEMPEGSELQECVGSVLEVIYLVFNEGYSATGGDALIRTGLCEDALRLARIVAQLVPNEPEAHGLLALLEIQASRAKARVDARGGPVLLSEQDRSKWDQLLIQRGLAALATAESLRRPFGPYTLQASIAACHARALTAGDTDWEAIVALYDALVELTNSPVAELNRVVAISFAFGPKAALEALEPLLHEPVLRNYYLLPSVHGDILEKLGRCSEARAEFERAAAMTENRSEKRFLTARAERCRT